MCLLCRRYLLGGTATAKVSVVDLDDLDALEISVDVAVAQSASSLDTDTVQTLLSSQLMKGYHQLAVILRPEQFQLKELFASQEVLLG